MRTSNNRNKTISPLGSIAQPDRDVASARSAQTEALLSQIDVSVRYLRRLGGAMRNGRPLK